MEIVDVAARGLGPESALATMTSMPLGARGRFRQPDRRNLGIGVGHARNGRVVGLRLEAADAAYREMAVVVGEVREAAEAQVTSPAP